jgi:hypothetical protein
MLVILVRFGLWCLIPLSTIFQLYRGSQFYCCRKKYPVSKCDKFVNLLGARKETRVSIIVSITTESNRKPNLPQICCKSLVYLKSSPEYSISTVAVQQD